MSSLSEEFAIVYNTLKARQPLKAHTISMGGRTDSSNLGYWINRELPQSGVNLYNKWFGDNVHHYHQGVVILLPTAYGFRSFSRKFTYQQLRNIILNPDNYEFVSNGMQTTTTGICCEWGAEMTSLNKYFEYLSGCDIRL